MRKDFMCNIFYKNKKPSSIIAKGVPEINVSQFTQLFYYIHCGPKETDKLIFIYKNTNVKS